MKQNIIFDLGGVLLRWEPLEHVRRLLGPGALAERVCRAVLEAPEWQDLDRGTLEEDEALIRFLKRLPGDEDAVRRVFAGLFEVLVPIEPHVALLPLLRAAGKRLFVLSNFSRRGYAYVSSRYDFFRFFDGGVVSYDVKLLKPEREIYETLLSRYALDPATCLFFDDREENVAASRAAGIDAVVVRHASPEHRGMAWPEAASDTKLPGTFDLKGEMERRGLLEKRSI